MGFRCPACHMDFGTDKKSFNDHIVLCSNIYLDDIDNIDIERLGEEQAKRKVYESAIRPTFKEMMENLTD